MAMPISLLDFFPAPTLGTVPQVNSALPPHIQHCLLSGEERSETTTLLFQLAYSMAARGAKVLLLANRAHLEESPPFLSTSISPQDPAWTHVNIKYVKNGYELLRFFSLIHALSPAPDIVLVDTLHKLVDGPGGLSLPGANRSRDAMMCKLLAMMRDGVAHISKSKNRSCPLIVADSVSGEGPRSLHILQRWLPFTLTTKALDDGKFSLSVLSSGRLPGVAHVAHLNVEYSLNNGLTLEGLSNPMN